MMKSPDVTSFRRHPCGKRCVTVPCIDLFLPLWDNENGDDKVISFSMMKEHFLCSWFLTALVLCQKGQSCRKQGAVPPTQPLLRWGHELAISHVTFLLILASVVRQVVNGVHAWGQEDSERQVRTGQGSLGSFWTRSTRLAFAACFKKKISFTPSLLNPSLSTRHFHSLCRRASFSAI